MQYLTYEQYKNIGGLYDITAFNRSVVRACSIIDNSTNKRIETMNEVSQQAKELCRDLIDYISVNSVAEKSVTSRSQSAGGVSESESYSEKTIGDMYEDMNNLVYDYLASVNDDKGIPLLYRGAL